MIPTTLIFNVIYRSITADSPTLNRKADLKVIITITVKDGVISDLYRSTCIRGQNLLVDILTGCKGIQGANTSSFLFM